MILYKLQVPSSFHQINPWNTNYVSDTTLALGKVLEGGEKGHTKGTHPQLVTSSSILSISHLDLLESR